MFFRGATRSIRDQNRHILEQIETGSPIEPQHDHPRSIDQDGFEWFIRPHDREGFAITSKFALQFNRILKHSSWRVQEESSVLLRHYDQPHLGRNFLVYFNTHLAGRLSLDARGAGPILGDQTLDGFYIFTEIDFAQLYRYEMLNEFLHYCCMAMSADMPQLRALKQSAEGALLKALWEITREPNEPYTIEFGAEGSLHTILHWNENMRL